MHPLTVRREEPYVWASWLTRLLAGEASCLWSAWLRAHHHAAKGPSDFLKANWQMDHAALLRQAVAEYERDGYAVQVEGQNRFTLRGRVGCLSGKPDLVAVREREAVGWVVDAKTGTPRASDRVQVMLYMWALPRAHPAYAGVRFCGRVVYKTGYSLIDPDEIDEPFGRRVGEMMAAVCGAAEPRRAPSYGECRYCPVTLEDCPNRVTTEKAFEGETDEF